jgi:hypothetical protein
MVSREKHSGRTLAAKSLNVLPKIKNASRVIETYCRSGAQNDRLPPLLSYDFPLPEL